MILIASARTAPESPPDPLIRREQSSVSYLNLGQPRFPHQYRPNLELLFRTRDHQSQTLVTRGSCSHKFQKCQGLLPTPFSTLQQSAPTQKKETTLSLALNFFTYLDRKWQLLVNDNLFFTTSFVMWNVVTLHIIITLSYAEYKPFLSFRVKACHIFSESFFLCIYANIIVSSIVGK